MWDQRLGGVLRCLRLLFKMCLMQLHGDLKKNSFMTYRLLLRNN